MSPYKLVLDYRAVEFLQRLSRNDQRHLHNRLVELSHYPHNLAHRPVRGESGREYFINAQGKFSIKRIGSTRP